MVEDSKKKVEIADASLKQAKSQQDEYMRLIDEHAKLQVETRNFLLLRLLNYLLKRPRSTAFLLTARKPNKALLFDVSVASWHF